MWLLEVAYSKPLTPYYFGQYLFQFSGLALAIIEQTLFLVVEGYSILILEDPPPRSLKRVADSFDRGPVNMVDLG